MRRRDDKAYTYLSPVEAVQVVGSDLTSTYVETTWIDPDRWLSRTGARCQRSC